MRITGRKILVKLKKKNQGNKKLCEAIDDLTNALEAFNPDQSRIKDIRKDADCVHSDGFTFF